MSQFFTTCGKSLAAFMDKTPNKRSNPAANNSAIEMALIKCRSAAKEGYDIAGKNYVEIQKTLSEEVRRIADANNAQNQVDRIQNTKLIEEQASELKKLEQRINVIGNNLANLHERQKDFSIVVYGRTMAGKSTLMEILTHGNGNSIGKGSQRTTRDVRNYYWNGLKITDVPGICAFDGKKDERLAMDAAKSADLILFLITNDAPQADEAACLAQLKSLGKPILGLINVKSNFNLHSPDWDIDLEDLQEKLADTSTINSIVNQFKAFDKKHNQDWSNIKFVATHLLSAYQAHPCRGNNAQVYAASKFAKVEKFILNKIRNDGRFLRIKTFVDAVSVPMCDIVLKIYKHSAAALLESAVWFDKRDQLNEWQQEFVTRSRKKLDALYNELSEKLKKSIYTFAENHYEDENVNENWIREFKGLHFEEDYQNLLTALANECTRKRRELSDELTQELKFTSSRFSQTCIELYGTTPWGEIGVAALGGLGAVGVFAAERLIGIAFPPLGIALAAISIIGWIFTDNKAEKIRKAKEKLRKDLNNPSFEMLNKMHNQVVQMFQTEIVGKGIHEFATLLTSYRFMFARLGKSQNDIANKLSQKYRQLNAILLEEAIKYKSESSSLNLKSKCVIRIPGEKMILLDKKSNFYNDLISSLLGEKFETLKPKQEFYDTLKMLLGCDYKIKRYPLEFDEPFAIAAPKNVDKRKINLAQQIACAPIIEG